MKRVILLLMFVVFVVGCTPGSKIVSFEEGVERIKEIDAKYGSNMMAVPLDAEGLANLRAELVGFRSSNELDPALEALLDFRIKILEAKTVFDEGWKHGRSGTTEFGFGCKMFDKVIESSELRVESAQIGNEAVQLLQNFIDNFPEQAKSLNLTQREVLVMKTLYFEVQETAERDNRLMRSGCEDKIEESDV